jgi:hypothetical protein
MRRGKNNNEKLDEGKEKKKRTGVELSKWEKTDEVRKQMEKEIRR